ncbi:hypothetical protein DFH09DRAFT_1104878 [Mycena vulgaris]|nr:hypothetical protein DFH09DRAFT_1104878 [Mycena vulgaris]
MAERNLIVAPTFYSSPKTPKEKQMAPKKASVPTTPASTSTPPHPPADAPSIQTRLRKKKRADWEKVDGILATITKDFRSLGAVLEARFYNRISGVADPRTQRHVRVSAAFLGGESNVTIGTIINLIYNHRQSRAPKASAQYSIAGPELRRQVGVLTQNDPSDPTDTTQLRASTNGSQKVQLATWDTFVRVSIPFIATKYKGRSRAVCSGQVQVGAISALTLSRNSYASGYLALPLAPFGFTVHDTMARACLHSLTDSSLAKLRESVVEGIANGTMYWQIVLDNVQQYFRQRDHRPGRQDVLKVDTAATAILLQDCAPGAINPQDHLDRVMKQKRRQLTISSLYSDIDWPYIHELTALHWVRILVHFVPQLAYLCPDVAVAFTSEQMTKRRPPKGRPSVMRPLMTNAERETETQGMMCSILDFEGQLGLDEKAMEGLMFIAHGDRALVAAMWRIKIFLAAHPEINGIVDNSCGPASATDLVSVEKRHGSGSKGAPEFEGGRLLSNIAQHDIIFRGSRFGLLVPMQNPPDLHYLWAAARKLVKRYASQQAYTQALNTEFSDSAPAEMRVPLGTAWVAPIAAHTEEEETGGEPEEEEADPVIVDEPGEEEEVVSEAEEGGKKRKKKNKRPSVHVEAEGFTGGRVFTNETLFLQDMGWWAIAAHAVPDGEIGQVWEILKAYCLHRYESSPEFSDVMLNNWLVSLSGHRYVECDWAQEHFNKWLGEMVAHEGGDFDDHFYRHTLALNVMHFRRIKEQIESTFDIKRRGKTHGTLSHSVSQPAFGTPTTFYMLQLLEEDPMPELEPREDSGGVQSTASENKMGGSRGLFRSRM